MIYKDDKEISSINTHNKVITAIYRGARLVGQGIKSCFGKGLGINKQPWVNSDGGKII